MRNQVKWWCVGGLVVAAGLSFAAPRFDDAFAQLDEHLPTPTSTRNAAGAPGHAYWQQEAHYVMDVELDDASQRIVGDETITYVNHSPDTLTYLWLQIETNLLHRDSLGSLADPAPAMDTFSHRGLARLVAMETFDGRSTIHHVTDSEGKPLPHTVVGTMMRIDLPEPLKHEQTIAFSVGWSYRVNDAKTIRFRTGYEYFPEDKNYIYEIAHFYPRMAAYTDYAGWQNKQFLGSGEFTLEFGDYDVSLTVPADHIVGATGELTNAADVLTTGQRARLARAAGAKAPVFVVTPDEAVRAQKSRAALKSKKKKTWRYAAEDVRDFAFASSRRFIWDAMGHAMKRADGSMQNVMAMSLYPKEGEGLWAKYSTHAIIHTLDVYSRYTIPYPYPVAYSVNGPVGGMEYPMICFNGPRPEKDGTYYDDYRKGDSWWKSKYGLISVIIHEVGHNYFPMIVNSDERQWTWMDEGLNTFMQFLAEQEWEEDYPARRGEPRDIVSYMTSDYQVPIMTNSESLLQFGNNAYAKPATALNILRETILGRELFDFAFRTYAERWAFKRPEPADFFRTMEDASGVDLDWFWRGWFYSTDHVDIAIASVQQFEMASANPDVDKAAEKQREAREPKSLTVTRDRAEGKAVHPMRVEQYPTLKDFYNRFDKWAVTDAERDEYKKMLEELEPEERAALNTKRNFFVIEFTNIGGLVMPLILQLDYTDGAREVMRIPAEIWRFNQRSVKKLLMTERVLKRVTLDPHWETADANVENNHWPRRAEKTRFQLFKEKADPSPMKEAKEAKEKKAKAAKEGKK